NRPACKAARDNGNHETTPARAPCYVSLPYGVRLAMACQESETYLTSAAFLEAADGEEALARHLEFAGRAPPLGNRRPRRRGPARGKLIWLVGRQPRSPAARCPNPSAGTAESAATGCPTTSLQRGARRRHFVDK